MKITDIKFCGRCKTHKVKAEAFARNINTRDTFNDWCRDCMRIYRQQRKAKAA